MFKRDIFLLSCDPVFTFAHRSKVGVACVAAAVALLGGCANAPLQQRVPVATHPTGANASVVGGPACLTPCTVDLERNRDHILTLSKNGFQTQTIRIERQYRTADVWLGALSSGLETSGNAPDAAKMINRSMQSVKDQEQSGAAYDLAPGAVSVMLQPR